MTELNIRRLRSGGIITNYFCTSRCGHCLYNCSPQWEKEYITPLADESYPVLTTLGRYGIRGLVKMAEAAIGYKPQKDFYINKCDLCTEVRFCLVQNGYGESKELQPQEFYFN